VGSGEWGVVSGEFWTKDDRIEIKDQKKLVIED